MKEPITFVGLDAHKNTIVVAMLLPGEKQPEEWRIAHEPKALRRLVAKLKRSAVGGIRCCYEAGPCGYALQRRLEALGVECRVIAPSLIPIRPGTRLKTDRRDARKLAELFRAGLLTEVHPPTEDEESVRDLVRCRDDAQRDLTRARNRIGKFLLRRGLVFGTGNQQAWSQRWRWWVQGLQFEREADRIVFEDYLLAVDQQEARRQALDVHLRQASEREPYRTPVGILRCFRGIDTLTALALVAELHDPRRFPSPRHLMGYLGLVPSEKSSGDHRRQGGITGTGNRHLRRLLIEASWHYRHKAQVGVRLRQRRQGQPAHAIALADRAQRRLCRRFRRMSYQGKHMGKINIAIARELVGYLWQVLQSTAVARAA
jgi:transposase